MKYIVDEEVFTDIEEVADYLSDPDYYAEDRYDFEDWVNDAYGYITIGEECFNAFDIAKDMSQWLYGELHDAYCKEKDNNDLDDLKYDLERATPGERIEYHNKWIVVEDDGAGDTDGDDVLEALRKRLAAKQLEDQMNQVKDKEADDILMNVIRGE